MIGAAALTSQVFYFSLWQNHHTQMNLDKVRNCFLLAMVPPRLPVGFRSVGE